MIVFAASLKLTEQDVRVEGQPDSTTVDITVGKDGFVEIRFSDMLIELKGNKARIIGEALGSAAVAADLAAGAA